VDVTISKGDGSMQRLIDNDQCPKCKVTMTLYKQVKGDLKGYQCRICKLIIEGDKKD